MSNPSPIASAGGSNGGNDASSQPETIAKIAPGSGTDFAWKHGISTDGDQRKIQKEGFIARSTTWQELKRM
ncbi:hypothetical protein ACSQ67_009894 [Phaseolus vulgaris]